MNGPKKNDSKTTREQEGSALSRLLLAVRHQGTSDALMQILSRLSKKTQVSVAHSVEEIQALAGRDFDLLLADSTMLLDQELRHALRALRTDRPLQPLIALLPIDSYDYRDAAVHNGANGIVIIDDAPSELLPTVERLLSRCSTVAGVAERIEESARSAAPIGEAAYGAQPSIDHLQQISDQIVEGLVQRVPLSGFAQLPPHAIESSIADSGNVFIRKLKLTAGSPSHQQPARIARTACNLNCGLHFCGLNVTVRGGQVTSIEPANFPDSRYRRICLKGISHLQSIRHPDRLLYPLKRRGARGGESWERISWEHALSEISAKIKLVSAQYSPQSLMFFIGSGQLSALNGFSGAYLRLASLIGASGISLSQFGLDSAIPSGIEETFGKGAGYIGNDFTDLVNSRLVVIWGADPAHTLMNWWPFFLEAQRAGTRLIAIDPKFTVTASKCDQWLPIRPGTDLYLALSILHVIVQRGWIDREFVLQHTVAPLLVREDDGLFLRLPSPTKGKKEQKFAVWDEALQKPMPPDKAKSPALRGRFEVNGLRCYTAFEVLAEMLSKYPPEKVAPIIGLASDQIVSLAETFALEKPARIFALYGIDRWHHGATFGRLIATLAALTGNLGIAGAGASVAGSTDGPILVSSFISPDGKEHLPVSPARLPEQILSEEPYPIKIIWAAFSNWLNQWPDQKRLIEQVLPKLDLFVVVDQFLTESARHADYILPAAHFFEREDMVRGPGPYIQYQPTILQLPGECRSDFEIAADLAARLGVGAYFSEPASHYLEEILSEASGGKEGFSYSELKEKGILTVENTPESLIAHHNHDFKTATRRVEFYAERLLPHKKALPDYEAPIEAEMGSDLHHRFPLICITEHSPYRVHSTFVNSPWLRELEREPQATVHPTEGEKRDIKDGELVRVFNQRGFVVLKARFSQTIPPGVIYLSQGWQSMDYYAGHTQSLTHDQGNAANLFGPNCSFSDVLVEMTAWKAGERDD